LLDGLAVRSNSHKYAEKEQLRGAMNLTAGMYKFLGTRRLEQLN